MATRQMSSWQIIVERHFAKKSGRNGRANSPRKAWPVTVINTNRMDDRTWAKIRENRDRSDAKHRREEEVSIADAIQRAIPTLNRPDALREAARIIAKRQSKPW